MARHGSKKIGGFGGVSEWHLTRSRDSLRLVKFAAKEFASAMKRGDCRAAVEVYAQANYVAGAYGAHTESRDEEHGKLIHPVTRKLDSMRAALKYGCRIHKARV